MSEDDNFDKEYRFDREDAAEFLRNIADSIESGDSISLDGDNWKVYQKFEKEVPFRITKDDAGLEFGFRLIDPTRNTRD
ncbi:MAG: amphi-Trp domain-containing protein [Candidatus Nanohaloarchaea archaeon]